jgi:hypothetical protein
MCCVPLLEHRTLIRMSNYMELIDHSKTLRAEYYRSGEKQGNKAIYVETGISLLMVP